MFNHLIATALICLGVARTTPISNYKQEKSNLVLTTPKKENVITEYTISVNQDNTTTNQYYGNTPMPNTYYPQSNFREAKKYNYSAGNAYLNVRETAYVSTTYTTVQDENQNTAIAAYIENYNIVNNDLDWKLRQRSETAYVYRIIPYNYNVETNIRIRNRVYITEWENQNNIEWYTYETYVIRNIYTSTEQQRDPITQVITYPWDNYIDANNTAYRPYDICRDIENVDNGFYYHKDQQLIKIRDNGGDGTWIDTIEINITPSVNNYIVIEYIPVVRPVEMGAQQSQETMYLQLGTMVTPYTTTPTTITGTNIIPDGTYEVIDIPGLMFEILGMPFAFVSQAFNLTLFPGTPYQINIANLFLSIIAIFVFVWLLLLFIKMKSGG